MEINKTKVVFRLCFSVITILLITACTKNIYGVPEEHWLNLNEKERLKTISGYNEVQKIKEERNLFRQKMQAERDRQERIEWSALQVKEQEKIDYIYQGYGHYGDLIRVTVQGGKIQFRGKHKAYNPVSLKLADGEKRTVVFTAKGLSRRMTQQVTIAHDDGVVLFDCGKAGRQEDLCGRHFAYDAGWRRGKEYKAVFLDKWTTTEAKNISVAIHFISVR